MKIINQSELRRILEGITGSNFVSFTYVKPPKMNKTGNPYLGKVVKIQRVNANICFDYAAGVERRLEKEGKDKTDWTPGTSWHCPIVAPSGSITPLVVNKKDTAQTKPYLCVNSLKVLHSEFRLTDGSTISRDVLKPWMPDKDSYSNQNLDNPLRVQTYELEYITSIRIDGEDYEIV